MDITQTVLTALGSSGVAAGITGYVGHKLRSAQAQQITVTAHHEIYKAYGELLDELRAELIQLRSDLAGAERRARDAEAEARSLRAEVDKLRDRVSRHEQREQQLLAELARLTA